MYLLNINDLKPNSRPQIKNAWIFNLKNTEFWKYAFY
jgi:hypothetical protein